jgi:hypothetical protein
MVQKWVLGLNLGLLEVKDLIRLLLTATNSHSSRQLLGNNMGSTLCSIHILFIFNESLKFWMSSDYRSRCTKNEQKWAKSQAGRPLLGRPAWNLQEHGPGFDPVAMRQTHEALSRRLGLGSIGCTERH